MAMRRAWPPDRPRTGFADHGVEPFGHRHDLIQDVGVAECGAKLGFSGVGAGKQQVFADAGVEQMGLLRHHGTEAAHRLPAQVPQRHPADLDRPLLEIPEAEQDIEQARLARAGLADHTKAAAFGNREADTVERPRLGLGVAHFEVADPHVELGGWVRFAAGLADRPGWCR